MALEFTDSNFEEVVLESGKLSVVDFWAVWCGPCRMVGPIIEELHNEHENVVIGKVNVDENPTISMRYRVRNIPTVLFIKDGKIVDKVVGAAPKATYAAKIAEHA